MPKIAIIGTEGSGKTVLAAVLAKNFSQPDANKPYLVPENNATIRYVEEIWFELSAGRWPASTPAGGITELRWQLCVPSAGSPTRKWPVRLLDLAGQDLRYLFGRENVDDTEGLKGRLPEIRDFVLNADVVVYMVNLEDFVGEADSRKRAATEASLKAAMDRKDSASRRTLLLFSRADHYGGLANEAGGWMELARRHLPYIFAAHLHEGQVSVGAVAAVATTEIGPDGLTRIPAKGFQSRGLDTLMKWISVASAEVDRAATAEAQAAAATARVSTREASRSAAWAAFRKSAGKVLPWVGAIAIILALRSAISGYENSRAHIRSVLQAQLQASQHAHEVKEIYGLSSWGKDYYAWNDDITFTNGSMYTLTNLNIVVTCLAQNGQTYTITLTAGQVDPQGTVTWEGESDSDLHHDLEAGPTYQSCTFTCDQTK